MPAVLGARLRPFPRWDRPDRAF